MPRPGASQHQQLAHDRSTRAAVVSIAIQTVPTRPVFRIDPPGEGSCWGAWYGTVLERADQARTVSSFLMRCPRGPTRDACVDQAGK